MVLAARIAKFVKLRVLLDGDFLGRVFDSTDVDLEPNDHWSILQWGKIELHEHSMCGFGSYSVVDIQYSIHPQAFPTIHSKVFCSCSLL